MVEIVAVVCRQLAGNKWPPAAASAAAVAVAEVRGLIEAAERIRQSSRDGRVTTCETSKDRAAASELCQPVHLVLSANFSGLRNCFETSQEFSQGAKVSKFAPWQLAAAAAATLDRVSIGRQSYRVVIVSTNRRRLEVVTT